MSLAMVLAGVAAIFHVYVFWLESFAWTKPRGRAAFGTTEEQANATRELAFNQGFYNLFLAVVTVAGVTALSMDHTAVGAALLYAGAGSMVAAGVVLWVSSPSKRRAAMAQLTVPALALVALTWALL
jgi:putative membrane protein